MYSESTLDSDVVSHIQGADKAIKQKSKWSAFDYKMMYNKLESLVCVIQEKYVQISGLTMNEAFMCIYKGNFNGSLKTFISHTNGLLYVRKLQRKMRSIREHSQFGIE